MFSLFPLYVIFVLGFIWSLRLIHRIALFFGLFDDESSRDDAEDLVHRPSPFVEDS